MQTPQSIDAVIFDLDDTLVEYVRSPEEMLSLSFDVVGVEPIFTVEEYYGSFERFAEQYDEIDELRAACFAWLAAENGHDPELGREAAGVYAERRDQSNVEPLPHAKRILDSFTGQFQLAIVTNGTSDAQRQKIEAIGLDPYVERVVIAGDETRSKPSPEPFEVVLDSLGVPPARAVYVGNSLESDVAGANAAGLNSVWLNTDDPTDGIEPDHQIEALDELLKLPWADTQ